MLSSSSFLKAIIYLLLSDVRAGEKNLFIKASTNSSRLLIDPYCKDSNQLVFVSLSENGNSCNFMTFGLNPFSFTMFAILKNLQRCSLGSSLGCPVNWCYCTMVIRAGFNSKLLASMGGYLTTEYSFLRIGLQKSSIVLCL